MDFEDIEEESRRMIFEVERYLVSVNKKKRDRRLERKMDTMINLLGKISENIQKIVDEGGDPE